MADPISRQTISHDVFAPSSLTHYKNAVNRYIADNICDPLSENPALPANIEFELEAILSVQAVFQLKSDYCTKVLQGACTVSY